jgi:hypothetical protein
MAIDPVCGMTVDEQMALATAVRAGMISPWWYWTNAEKSDNMIIIFSGERPL